MESEQRRGKSLFYLTVFPDDYEPEREYPAIILLHGFGANMQDLAALTPSIDTSGYLYICPNAPIGVNLGPGATGWAWGTPGENRNPAEMPRTERRLEQLFQEVMEEYKLAPGRMVLLGFSQGGGMTYRCGLGRPDLFAGLVALSSGLPDPDEMRLRLPPQRSQPIFIAHGLQDNIESAQRAKAFLEGEGYSPSYHEYDMGHEITEEMLEDLVPWLKQVLPPLA
ncbi:MAG: hypothetical protein EXR55_03410 [Dehalococcoidia bacterium]|nr:hypothetical protein [Dehalococcoidia bacterium]